MKRRDFMMASSVFGAASILGGESMAAAAATRRGPPDRSLKGPFLDLARPEDNMTAWARLLGNIDMKSTKFGWAEGIVQGVRPGEAIRDLVGFKMLSAARLLPLETGTGYRKVLREIGFYTDLRSGEIIEEWRNPYLDETVRVVPIANDPFNHTITPFSPQPPSYGGLNQAARRQIPLLLDWRRRGDTLNLFSHINLFYPSALQPDRWPRESGTPFAQVTEVFLYQIDWKDMQNRKKTSVEYNGTWSRTTPWLPWMLMGPTPGHAQYHTFMGAVDDLSQIDPKLVAYVERNYPKYLQAPERWEEPSLSSLEWYSRQQKPAPVPAGRPVPRAPDPELPPWFKAMQQQGGGSPPKKP
jgi:hypothetical protein